VARHRSPRSRQASLALLAPQFAVAGIGVPVGSFSAGPHVRHARDARAEDGSRWAASTRITAAVVAVGGIAATAHAGVGSGDLSATVTSWFDTAGSSSVSNQDAALPAAVPAPRAAADDAASPIADPATIASLAAPAAAPSAAARTVAVADTGRARAASAVQAATASVDQVRKAAEERARAAEAARAAGATGALQSASAGGAVSIVTGRVTSGFGSRWGTKHMGLDIAAPIGTPIHVPIAGTVISSGPASGFGMWVRVRHADGTVTVYGHINRSLVSVGQKVAAGQQIAEVGNRGQSTGPHLHIEVVDPGGTKINPKPWLDANGFRYT
jgi:murein DD-endopeptidase MepM/ murein hydrolase activator NlpD